MGTVTHKYDEFFLGDIPPKDFYVYGWVCEDWGGVYFYVGKGCKDRFKSLHNRNQLFLKIIERWVCFPVILKQGLTEEQALLEERKYKEMFTLELGQPIVDEEGDNLKQLIIRKRKEELRKQGVRVDGRPKVQVDNDAFQKFREKQKGGEMTVAECCEALNISRSTWYKKLSEMG